MKQKDIADIFNHVIQGAQEVWGQGQKPEKGKETEKLPQEGLCRSMRGKSKMSALVTR